MMHYELPILATPQDFERLRMSLRAKICHGCPYLTPGSESFGIEEQPKCEETCEIFTHLPRLIEAARRVDPMAGRFERVVNTEIRNICDTNPPPADTTGRRRPLIRHRRALIRELSSIVRH